MSDPLAPMPRFCPLCGAGVEVVRHVVSNVFEMMCERCGFPNVVMVNDCEKVGTHE